MGPKQAKECFPPDYIADLCAVLEMKNPSALVSFLTGVSSADPITSETLRSAKYPLALERLIDGLKHTKLETTNKNDADFVKKLEQVETELSKASRVIKSYCELELLARVSHDPLDEGRIRVGRAEIGKANKAIDWAKSADLSGYPADFIKKVADLSGSLEGAANDFANKLIAPFVDKHDDPHKKSAADKQNIKNLLDSPDDKVVKRSQNLSELHKLSAQAFVDLIKAANLPELVPDLNVALRQIALSGDFKEGPGLKNFRNELIDYYRTGMYLKQLAGPDFLDNPSGGFFQALSQAVLCNGIDKKKALEAFCLTSQVFSDKLSSYLVHGLFCYKQVCDSLVDTNIERAKFTVPPISLSVDSAQSHFAELRTQYAAQAAGAVPTGENQQAQLREEWQKSIRDKAETWIGDLNDIPALPKSTDIIGRHSRLTEELCPLVKLVYDQFTKASSNAIDHCKEYIPSMERKTAESIDEYGAASKRNWKLAIGSFAGSALIGPVMQLANQAWGNIDIFVHTVPTVVAFGFGISFARKAFQYGIEAEKCTQHQQMVKDVFEKGKASAPKPEFDKIEEKASHSELLKWGSRLGYAIAATPIAIGLSKLGSLLMGPHTTRTAYFLGEFANFTNSNLLLGVALAATTALFAKWKTLSDFKKETKTVTEELSSS